MDSFFAIACIGFLFIVAYAAFVIRDLSKENASLRDQLTEAQKNDARNPTTGHYIGQVRKG